MYFQIVDSNEKCLKVYSKGDFYDYSKRFDLTKTWRHSPHLSDHENVDYAYLYSDGTIESVCPIFVKDSWERTSAKISSFMKTIVATNSDLKDHCIYDYIPENFLLDFLKDKEAITKYVFENLSKPFHYDILKKAHILTEEMNARSNFYDGRESNTNYSIFGTRTGRLSNRKSGIPILTMTKEDRKLLKPKNDLFVEFDFNAAELRTLLALSGAPQPEIDIHEWTRSQTDLSREETKKRTFAWLYNPTARDSMLEGLYSRDYVKDRYSTENGIHTPFLRKIETDERRSLNYIVQSTSSDVCIEQVFKLRKLFQDRRTKICYLLHDSVILDFAKEDKDLFLEAKGLFSETRFGKYLVNSSIGKTFGEMKKI